MLAEHSTICVITKKAHVISLTNVQVSNVNLHLLQKYFHRNFSLLGVNVVIQSLFRWKALDAK